MVKEIESLKKENLIIGSDFYVKESLCHIHIFSDCIYITNLKNALKRGKTCKRYCLSFKNSIKIVYPLQTTRLKVVDKVSFRTNKSYLTNNKLYQIIFIDKDSQQRLYVFDTIKNYDLFDHIKTNKDTSNINSYFDDERVSFEDSVLVTFKVPVPVQMFLSKHKNYKIRIISKDLTTQERG